MSRLIGLAIGLVLVIAGPLRAQPTKLPFTIERTVATQGFDAKTCWVHARAGAIPGTGDAAPTVVMTLQKLQLSGSDVFYALNEMRTTDRGKTWSSPVEHSSFARVPFAFDGQENLEITVCDFWPKWHAKTEKLLGIGHTVVYENNRVRKVRPRGTAYAVYDPDDATWSSWRTIEMPPEAKFRNAGAGCVQRLDLASGDILLPIYFKEVGKTQYATTVLRCGFDGETLSYLQHGSELTAPAKRGLYEPSLTQFAGRYYLTMRNDDHGYISVSEGNGSLKFSEPKKWTFDDGSDLGNYNTQQHWVRHPKHGLWLVYTRRGADNDHVFRHRAPLFIAKVDVEKLRVIRATEQILVPEKGARLGNFGVTEISDDETWVTATEWMQGPAPHHHDPKPLVARGADNRVWVAKIKWTPQPQFAVEPNSAALLRPTAPACRIESNGTRHGRERTPHHDRHDRRSRSSTQQRACSNLRKLVPTRKVVYKTVSDRKLHLHIFEPEGHRANDRRPVFLAIHGGGWNGGNAQSFYPLAAHFAQHGMLGISLEYRLKSNKAETTVFDCVRDARSAVSM